VFTKGSVGRWKGQFNETSTRASEHRILVKRKKEFLQRELFLSEIKYALARTYVFRVLVE
jgi:hypothetical protein